MVLTSNIAPSGWDEFFTGDDTLLCALDRPFDKASMFVMRDPSYRGRGLDTYSAGSAGKVYREFRTNRRPLNVLSVLRRTVEQETSYAALPGANKRATPVRSRPF